MMRWTLGFVFTADFSQVLLIHKEHPNHQKGKWNGLGGKYEDGETAKECIAREVQEESALKIPPESWILLGKVHGSDWVMDILTAAYPGEMSEAVTTTDEKVAWFPRTAIPHTKRNLYWLIPLCFDALAHCEIEQIDIQYVSLEKWR